MPAIKRSRPTVKRAKAGPTLLIASRKSIVVYRGKASRRRWTLSGD